MSFYTGSGFRCRRDRGCGYRILPASGENEDLDEAARARGSHERTRHSHADAVAPVSAPKTMSEIVDAAASSRVDLESGEQLDRRGRHHVHGRVFRCTCCVCGEKFEASGPRSTYCPKADCQARKGRAA